MEVAVNSKIKILKNFAGEYLLWIFCSFFAGMYLTVPMTAIFGDYFDISNKNSAGAFYFIIFVFITSFVFIAFSVNKRHSYKLSINEDVIEFSGRSGWLWVDRSEPIRFISKITVGGTTNSIEKLVGFQGGSSSFFKKRLVFYFIDYMPIPLNNAAKIFETKSLNQFLDIAVNSGIKIKINP